MCHHHSQDREMTQDQGMNTSWFSHASLSLSTVFFFHLIEIKWQEGKGRRWWRQFSYVSCRHTKNPQASLVWCIKSLVINMGSSSSSLSCRQRIHLLNWCIIFSLIKPKLQEKLWLWCDNKIMIYLPPCLPKYFEWIYFLLKKVKYYGHMFILHYYCRDILLFMCKAHQFLAFLMICSYTH